jgi:F0F1-type ATP synthase assembly protein I
VIAWHGAPMSDQGENGRAGGALLAASIIGGTIVGVIIGQPSAGIVGGTGVGLFLLLILWLVGRRSRRSDAPPTPPGQ